MKEAILKILNPKGYDNLTDNQRNWMSKAEITDGLKAAKADELPVKEADQEKAIEKALADLVENRQVKKRRRDGTPNTNEYADAR